MKIKQAQIRYIKDGDARNYPVNLTAQDLISGAFLSDTIRITQLKISCIYGLKFYLNDTITPLEILPQEIESIEDGLIGESVTWQYDTSNIKNMPIYNIKIDGRSLQRFLKYNENGNDFLIIDYSYQIN